jgi:hypothetical protein
VVVVVAVVSSVKESTADEDISIAVVNWEDGSLLRPGDLLEDLFTT